MSSAIVRGLCTLPAPPAAVVLSPRGAQKAAALYGEFPSLTRVAGSNQEVVDCSDVVFVGVLPKQAEEVLRCHLSGVAALTADLVCHWWARQEALVEVVLV